MRRIPGPSLLAMALAISLGVSCGHLRAQDSSPLPLASRSDLIGVYHDAALNNADLAAARAEYRAIHEAVPQACAGLLPQLNAGANLTDTSTHLDQLATRLDRSGLVWQASLSQALFRADRWFQWQAAKAIDQQAALQLAALEQNLILQSAEACFAVLRTQDSLATNKAEEAAYQCHYEEARGRFEMGLSALTDVLEAQAAHDNARVNRIVAQRQVEEALLAFNDVYHAQPHPVIQFS